MDWCFAALSDSLTANIGYTEFDKGPPNQYKFIIPKIHHTLESDAEPERIMTFHLFFINENTQRGNLLYPKFTVI